MKPENRIRAHGFRVIDHQFIRLLPRLLGHRLPDAQVAAKRSIGFAAEDMRARGREVHVTREPSDGPIGKLLRGMLTGDHAIAGQAIDQRTFGLLFAADRMDHCQREVAPHIAAGTLVISDRWYHSSLAYQGTGAERGSTGSPLVRAALVGKVASTMSTGPTASDVPSAAASIGRRPAARARARPHERDAPVQGPPDLRRDGGRGRRPA